MEEKSKRIKITIGGVAVEAALKPTRTAQAIYDALPVEANVNQWGEEFYCQVPGVKDYRETATTNVKVGDVAYWGLGGALAVFFGRTPMSIGEDPVPADRVNVIGRLIGDPKVLHEAVGATMMKVEKVAS
ncbi:MAG: cyclophilin-like fold protein [Nitrospira sp.]|nr:cyclophilin-like fold protein [Nitrospira sp.]